MNTLKEADFSISFMQVEVVNISQEAEVISQEFMVIKSLNTVKIVYSDMKFIKTFFQIFYQKLYGNQLFPKNKYQCKYDVEWISFTKMMQKKM